MQPEAPENEADNRPDAPAPAPAPAPPIPRDMTAKAALASVMECGKSDAKPKVCGAKTRSGGTCQKPPLQGRTRCKLHGGATPRGADSVHFKHGLYQRSLPKDLKSNFEKLISDPHLLEGRAEVALMQLRLSQLSHRVQTNASGDGWNRLRTLLAELSDANAARDQERLDETLLRIGALVEGEVNDEAAWSELTDFVEKATRIAEREWKRVVANRQVISLEQVHSITVSLIAAVNQHVKDTNTRLLIAEQFKRLNVASVESLEGSGGRKDVDEHDG